MPTAVDTGKATGRRPLHFNSIADISADIDRLAACKEIHTLGNWSAGQIFKHLATVMNGSIDGIDFVAPWYIRVIARLFLKRRFLTKPMPAGFQLPKAAAKELVPPAISLEEGLQSIRTALGRLQTETRRSPSPVLGPLTREEWEQLHCRHSELHLSFLVPVE